MIGDVFLNNKDRQNRVVTEAQSVTRGPYKLPVSFTHIYLPFLWVWAGRSPRSRFCRGSASCSGCSLPRWCCVHTRSPTSPCRTRSCWRAGCTCTWDREITAEDRQTYGCHTLTVVVIRWREWSKPAVAVEPLFLFDRATLKSYWVIWSWSCIYKASYCSPL